ncbi:hypothetical protein [Rhodopirellula halodulae]|uniref:hypothetical protein n=1 Tax=Rhodopirellula halodulae TaxID=2894198 RepID=UPI001E2C0A88|nr:hypothetical protein [Rhodopirellula sp. JC737]MCC9656601.1 hypothetical protein [Rhodopirellula sp. JC737]
MLSRAWFVAVHDRQFDVARRWTSQPHPVAGLLASVGLTREVRGRQAGPDLRGAAFLDDPLRHVDSGWTS